jgi:hypothetical protein
MVARHRWEPARHGAAHALAFAWQCRRVERSNRRSSIVHCGRVAVDEQTLAMRAKATNLAVRERQVATGVPQSREAVGKGRR